MFTPEEMRKRDKQLRKMLGEHYDMFDRRFQMRRNKVQEEAPMPVIVNTVSLSEQENVLDQLKTKEVTVKVKSGNDSADSSKVVNKKPKLIIKNSKGEIQNLPDILPPSNNKISMVLDDDEIVNLTPFKIEKNAKIERCVLDEDLDCSDVEIIDDNQSNGFQLKNSIQKKNTIMIDSDEDKVINCDDSTQNSFPDVEEESKEGNINSVVESKITECKNIEISKEHIIANSENIADNKNDATETNKSKSSIENTLKDSISISSNDDDDKIFDKFLESCIKIDDSDDMKGILNFKIMKHYKLADEKYKKSQEFKVLIKTTMSVMDKNARFIYIQIKNVLDELKLHKSSANENEVDQNYTKTNTKIRLMEKKISIINRRIKELEEEEVDCDDEDSAYIKVDRYKARVLKLYNKLCELNGDQKLKAKKPIKKIIKSLDLDTSRIPNLSNVIEEMLKNNPHWFPDRHDIIGKIKHCAKKNNLKLTDKEIEYEGQLIFNKLGKTLQNYRKEAEGKNFLALMSEYDPDPAENNKELETKLNKNRIISIKKEEDIINEFALKEAKLQSNSDVEQNVKIKNKGIVNEKPSTSKSNSNSLQKERVKIDTENDHINTCDVIELDDSD